MALSDEVNDVKLLALASERMVKADPAMFVPAEHLYAELGITQDDFQETRQIITLLISQRLSIAFSVTDRGF